jgi:hypothetical protein
MIRRSTWITLAVFAALVVAAFIWQRYKKEAEPVIPTPTFQLIQPALYDLGTDIITWIQFADAEGNVLEVERESGSDPWVMVGETAETSDSFRIGTVAGQLLSIRAMTTFETELGIETVGLKNPAYTITIKTAAGEEIVTNIGNLTAIGNGYYIQVDEGEVVVVAKLVLDEVLGILTEPPLLATPTPEVTETLIAEDVTPVPDASETVESQTDITPIP